MGLRAFLIFSLLLVTLASLGAGCRPYHRRGLEIDVEIHSKDYHKHHPREHRGHHDHDDNDHDRD